MENSAGFNLMRLKHRGVTLIEAVLFISIALGLIVGGLVFYQQAALSQRIQSQVRDISAIVSEARAMMRTNRVDTDINIGQVLVAAGAVPSDIILDPPVSVATFWGVGSIWTNAPAVLRNRWGLPLAAALESDVLVGGGAGYLRVTLYGIPVQACARLIPTDSRGSGIIPGTRRVALARVAPSDPYVRWYVGGGPPGENVLVDIGSPTGLSVTTPLLEVSPSFASDLCARAANGGPVNVALMYMIDVS